MSAFIVVLLAIQRFAWWQTISATLVFAGITIIAAHPSSTALGFAYQKRQLRLFVLGGLGAFSPILLLFKFYHNIY
jgi:hypothetical protein